MTSNSRGLVLGMMLSVFLAAGNLGCSGGASSAAPPPPIAVAVFPSSGTALAGGTTQLTATVSNDSSNQGVSWKVSCSAASCGSVSPTATASGAATTYTAPPPPASDLQVTVKATSAADSQAAALATVTVPAITVAMQPATNIVPGNTTAQFTATVGNDLANKGVTWTVSCSPAPCGSVSPTSTASGAPTTYTAPPQSPSDLTVTITATSVADPTKSSSGTATVPAIRLSPISPISALLPISTTQQFTATVNYDASNQGVNWTLTQNGAACSPACGTIGPTTTSSGAPTTYTAPGAVQASPTVTLIATSVANTTKSAQATVTLTNGTVKLVPESLTFQCKKGLNCPPPAQTVALTNTGITALTINSITLTGSEFSQTNNCPASVSIGNSCTISVGFNPTKAGNTSGAVSISDSSADSPQQIALSGTGDSAVQANQAQARSDLAATTFAVVPPPTGPNPVGTRVLYITDPVREDPYLANGTKRELAVRFWYPASANSVLDCKPADYASPAVWRYFAQLAGVLPFPVTTNSCWNAPIADGVRPVVLFTPGYTATATDYTFLLEDLASRGYVVASISHTYEATAVEFPAGRLARSVVGSHLGGPVRRKGWSMSSAVVVRLLDLKAVLNEIERLNARRDSPFAGKLDVAKIVIAGHSLGGLTAFLGTEFDPRLKAAVMLDGFVPDALGSASRKPVLILAAGRQRWDAGECRLWSNLQGPRLAVNLRGTEHVALSDWIWLTPNAVQVGPMGSERTMAAVRDYIAAFLDANLRDEPAAPLLTGASATYPDAMVTTQDQSLCREP
jgi:pimeloyl-ACP methyl ester carboxylesterase